MIDFIESVAETWLPILWRASLQGGIAILIVFVVMLAARRWFQFPAWGEHWVWRLVYLKMLIALIAAPILLPILPPQVIDSPVFPFAESSSVFLPAQETEFAAPATVSLAPLSDESAVATRTSVARHQAPKLIAFVVLFAAWFIGASLSLLVLVRQFLVSYRLPLQPIDAPWLIAECERLSKAYDLRQTPKLAVSDHVHGPMLVGLLRPTIVFSQDVLVQCTREQLRAVLAHELSHMRRCDLRWNLLPAIVRVIFFFHPLLWLANHRWGTSSELASDALAIERCSGSVSEYADGLLRIAVLGTQRYRLASALGRVGAFHSTHTLKQRLVAMKHESVCSPRRAALYAVCIVAIGLLGVLPIKAVSRAADPGPDNIGKNMDFEEKSEAGTAAHWGGGGHGYTLKLDDTQHRSGKSSGLIAGESENGFGTFTQCIDTQGLAGKRIAYRGFLKSDTAGTGGLWMRVDAGQFAVSFDNMQDRRIKGKTDWAQQEIVLDVPTDATKICFGFLLTGDGKLWGDDLSVEVLGPAGEGPSTTGGKSRTRKRSNGFTNGDFEEPSVDDAKLPNSWGGGGAGYRLSRDEETNHSGAASGRIKKTSGDGEFGTFTQMFPAKGLLGKRVRLSGWLKTQEAQSAGLWLRVDGPDKQLLGFDNMQTRPVKGTTDWTEYSIVLDVPQTATDLALGFLAIGDGIVWGDDLKLEAIGPAGEGPDTTGSDPGRAAAMPKSFVNTGFDEASKQSMSRPAGWGGGGQGYRLTRDQANKHAGTASGRIEKVGDGQFGTFTQMFTAQDFLGKRVRYTGMLKTKDAESAGLWIRIDGPERTVLGFDNMIGVRVTGTSDWSEYSIAMDVPEEATHIALGFLSSGEGTAWGDSLKLEIVPAD